MTVRHDVRMSVSTSKAECRNGDTDEGKHSMHKLSLQHVDTYVPIMNWKAICMGCISHDISVVDVYQIKYILASLEWEQLVHDW